MQDHPAAPPPSDTRHTVSYALVVLLVLGTALSLPFAMSSVAQNLRRGSNDRVQYTTGTGASARPAFRVHLDITTLDQGGGFVTVRITAARGCAPGCTTGARLSLFTALSDPGGAPFADAQFLPVIQTLDFPSDASTLSSELRLPIYGDTIRYPFDSWQLAMNVMPEAVLADGTRQHLSASSADGQIVFTAQNRVTRLELERRVFTQSGLSGDGAGAPALLGIELGFHRPLYLRLVTVLLVLLVGAAAAYAVFLRPLSDLIVNSGALVLGIWGVRAVLLGTDFVVVTAVDLALMSVILFLLVMLTLRTCWALEERSRFALLHRVAALRRAFHGHPSPPSDRR